MEQRLCVFWAKTLLFDERPNDAAFGVSWGVFGTNAAFSSNGGQLSISPGALAWRSSEEIYSGAARVAFVDYSTATSECVRALPAQGHAGMSLMVVDWSDK